MTNGKKSQELFQKDREWQKDDFSDYEEEDHYFKLTCPNCGHEPKYCPVCGSVLQEEEI